MKLHFYCYAAVALLAGCRVLSRAAEPPLWGPITNGVQMSISLKVGQSGVNIETNQSLTLLIRIKNVSSNDTFVLYRLNRAEADSGFSFVVLSPSGENVSPTIRLGRGSGALVSLGPQQSIDIDFRLGSICSFDKAGIYRIIAKREMWDRADRRVFHVVSNPLDVSLVAEKRETSPPSERERGITQ